MKQILLYILCMVCITTNAQYIGVKAKYTQTRLVPNDDPTLQDSRDNRLLLSFYEVTFNGTDYVWTPTVLSNYDIWIEPAGLQFGNLMGGVLDSIGNNYPGYAYTAPRVVSYYNSMGLNYFDCSPFYGTHYVVNGHELDCGWVRVSTWEWNESMQHENEFFNAPNINLPYYWFGHPYYYTPGNVNFNYYDLGAGPPYNMYNFVCGTLQLVMKGLLLQDTGSAVVLPVRFVGVSGRLESDNRATLSWTNLTESDITNYTIEKSTDGVVFQTIGIVLPTNNSGTGASYLFETLQLESKAFYRIKANETTGQIFYSNIILLNKNRGPVLPDDESSSLRIYPNPTQNGRFILSVTELPKGKYDVILVSATGQPKKISIIDHDGGSTKKMFDLHWVTPGMYTFIIRSSELTLKQKIIITN